MSYPDRLRNAVHRIAGIVLLSSFLMASAVLINPCPVSAGEGSDAELVKSLLSGADTLKALEVLDSLLKVSKDKAGLCLLRGRIRLARGEGQAALEDFRAAAGHKDKAVRLQVWLGLALTHRTLLHETYQAEQACRKGLSIDRNDPALLFESAMVGFAYGGADGYDQAVKYLSRVIEIDPMFNNAYGIWRDSLLYNPVTDPGLVRQAMKRWLESHPDKAAWRLDIAWDEFLAGRTDSALAVLERLSEVSPEFNSPDRELLLARCGLERGDSAVFMEHYYSALDLAAKIDQPTRAYVETEVILTSRTAPRWEECVTNWEKAAFLHQYWLDKDDDPVEPINRRLIEHYTRIRHAELKYSLRNPGSFYQNSGNANRLLSPQSVRYYYDSETMRRQNAILRLDPRGIVWVRQGAPDKIEKHPGQYKSRYDNTRNRYMDCEFWYYGKWEALFAYLVGAGDYVFIPQQEGLFVADMMSIMDTQYWSDPRVTYTVDYYMAQFLASNSIDNEVEFYQDDHIPKGDRPSATIAVYDSLWSEIDRREGEVFRIAKGKDTDHWLARHRISVVPGKYNYTIRMASGDEKWLGKGQFDFKPFEPGRLNLSAVVLGAPPVENQDSPERQGVHFVPRTTVRFGRDEEVKVYFEVYNLQPDSAGVRGYREWIDVIRLKEGEGRIKKYAGKVLQFLTFGADGSRTALTHVFDRQADWRGDRAPESFSLDVSSLESGSYRMVIQVRDNVSGRWDIEETFFDIQGDSEQATR